MKYMKYVFLLVLIVLSELALIYGMFVFVSVSKLFFVLASLLLILGALAYLVVSRHREKSKVKPKAEVWEGYFRVLYVVFVVLFSLLAGAIVIRALFFLVRGA
jgi:hypothetical protein